MPAIAPLGSCVAFAVLRPLLSLARSQKYSECRSKAAQFDRVGALLQVATLKAIESQSLDRAWKALLRVVNRHVVGSLIASARSAAVPACSFPAVVPGLSWHCLAQRFFRIETRQPGRKSCAPVPGRAI
jgi:hypothetical protein